MPPPVDAPRAMLLCFRGWIDPARPPLSCTRKSVGQGLSRPGALIT